MEWMDGLILVGVLLFLAWCFDLIGLLLTGDTWWLRRRRRRMFVIDTNQASLLPKGKKGWTVSLSPYVLSEILLRTNPNPTFELLRTFDIRVGLDTLDVMSQLARLSAREIRAFKPFHVPGQRYHQDYRALEEALYNPGNAHVAWAREIKGLHLEYCGSLVKSAQLFRKHLRESEIADRKFSTFEEAFAELASTPESFIGSVIVGAVANDGKRSVQTQPGELFEAVLANQYLARFFRVQMAYYISISRCWIDQDLNFDPSRERDDMTDVTLPLYAGDGDVIVTNDTKLSLLVRLIEPEGRVTTCKASDIVESMV